MLEGFCGADKYKQPGGSLVERGGRLRFCEGRGSRRGRGGGARKASGHGRRPNPAPRSANPPPPLRCPRHALPPRRRVQQYIREAYKDDWLLWSHEPELEDAEEEEEAEEGEGRLPHAGGFTMRRK